MNAKQTRFVEEYLIDLNATQAAIRAGYSERTAQEQSSRLLSNVMIQNEIASRIKDRERRTEVTHDRVLLEIARLAFNDPRKAFDQSGALLPIQEWPDEVAAAISSIKVNELKDFDGTVIGETKEIKFWDKGKQLDLAARHLGMLNDKLNVGGQDGNPIAVVARVERLIVENHATDSDSAGL
jgi:phage terminase small subunit